MRRASWVLLVRTRLMFFFVRAPRSTFARGLGVLALSSLAQEAAEERERAVQAEAARRQFIACVARSNAQPATATPTRGSRRQNSDAPWPSLASDLI
jgi:hypothetical protein